MFEAQLHARFIYILGLSLNQLAKLHHFVEIYSQFERRIHIIQYHYGLVDSAKSQAENAFVLSVERISNSGCNTHE